MKKVILVTSFLLYFQLCISQEIAITETPAEKKVYKKLDISWPFNLYSSEEDEDGKLFDGLNIRFGVGAKVFPWIHIGGMAELDWKAHTGLVIFPMYGTVKFCPRVSENLSIYVEPGFGKALELFNYHQAGYFEKLSCGLSDPKHLTAIYIEYCQYGLGPYDFEKISSIGIGITVNLEKLND